MEDNCQSDVFEGMILNTNQKVLVLKDRKEVHIADGDRNRYLLEVSKAQCSGYIYYVSAI